MANDWNQAIIDEFRSNAGKVGGRFAGTSLLLLHHTGARSGRVRVNPVAYQEEGDRFVIFGSNGGRPKNPDWYHNLRAKPKARIEVGTHVLDVTARVADGEERERIWARQKKLVPAFAEYEKRTDRPIPVIVLERAA